MKKQEQEQEEEVKKAPVTLATKVGIVALPMIPTILIDMITHGGLTPPALAAFGLSYVAFDRSPRVAAWLGENKEFQAYLEAHPDTLRKLDRLTKGYFSKQIYGEAKVQQAQPHEDEPCVTEKAQQQEVTKGDATSLEEMEDLAPNPLKRIVGALPRRSPTFAQMRHLITPQSDILGYDGRQFVFADSLKQSVNVALIGVPGSGKTSCLTFHTAQAVLRNAIIRGWDLHGDVAADLGDCFNILEDVNDIVADCEWIQAERERRLTLRKRAKAGDRSAIQQWKQTRELFYIVDEFNALMLRLKQRKPDRELVADTLLSLIAEGRKFKMRCIIAGQTMPAALFGEGGSSARDIINTKYAFQSRENHAQYFGIESRAIENLLPTISGRDSAGYAILDGGPLLHAIIVSIPYTTVEDIRALLQEGYGSQDEEDDLMDYMIGGGSGREETRTEELPVTRTYSSGKRSVASVATRREAREQRLRGTVVAQQRQGTARVQETPVVEKPALDPELQRAYDAFENQMSYRDFGFRLGVSKDTAGKYYLRLRDLGYIGTDGMRLV